MGELLGLSAGQLTLLGGLVLLPWTLLAFTVRRFITGDLVARQSLADVQADRDYWREIADKLSSAVLKQGMTLERLLVLAEAGDHALNQIQAGLNRPEDPR